MAKSPDFDQTPKKFKDLRTGDDFSFYKPPNKKDELDTGSCELHIADIPNLDIVKKVGRQTGDNVIYSADQTYNYLSPSSRYDAGLSLSPQSVTEKEGTTTYKFCSDSSPTGYWEVSIGGKGKATYINFEKNPLYIICPRPLILSELSGILTDSSSVRWEQIDGNRNVLIDTNTSFDPVITILTDCNGIGCNFTSLSPIILRVETDNPLLFNDLVIQNRLIDNYYGMGYAAKSSLGVPCQIVSTASIGTAPIYPSKAYLWQGTPLKIYWSNPACDSEFITGYTIAVLTNLNPPYQSYIEVSGNNRIATVEANKQYRLLTNFNFYGRAHTSTSEVFQFFYEPDTPDSISNNRIIFADESLEGSLGYALSTPKYNKVSFGVRVSDNTETANRYLSYAASSHKYNKVSFGVKTVDSTETGNTRISHAVSPSKYNKVNLGAVIIG
jgi:hypothetical protein